LILGLMMVYSASFDLGYRVHQDPNYYFVRQLAWVALGTGVLIALAQIDYHFWQRWAVPLMAGTLVLLGLVIVIGGERFGAGRWLLGGSVQPSELAKVTVAIYIAAWVTSKGEKIRKVSYGLIPFAILIGLITTLILMQRDLSTAVLIVGTAWAMFFFAGADLVQLFASVVFGVATFMLMIAREEFRLDRIVAFFKPIGDQSGASFHTQQTLVALASGGLLGRGLGASSQKFGILPTVHTDSIMAVLGEELGLIGCLILVGLFVLLIYRGFKIALEADDAFGTILASGLTCSLALQAAMNMGVITKSMPYAGVPLPFVSYGGSSMIASMACIGLLLSISRGRRTVARRSRASADLGGGNRRPRVSPAGRR